VYENKVKRRKLKRHKEAEITGISGNDVTINSIMCTADDVFIVTVIIVKRGEIPRQVGQQIFSRASILLTAVRIHQVRTEGFSPGGVKVGDTYS
jgi:hypothetical protein